MKKYLLSIKLHIISSLILYTLEVIITSVILLIPGFLIDHYTQGKMYIVDLVLLYIVIFSLYLVVCYFSNRVADYRRIKFEKQIKADFFEAVINKKYLAFSKYDVGEYLSMQANDITEMCQNYLSPLLAVIRSFIMIIVFGISLIVFVDFSIALFIILFSVVVVLIPNITGNNLAERNKNYMQETGRYTSAVSKYFGSYAILDKSAKDKITKLHQKDLNQVLDTNMHFRRLNSFAMVINGGAVEFISIVVFAIVAVLLYKNIITVGMATIAFTYSTKFMDPIYELNQNIGRIKSVEKIKLKLLNIIEQTDEVSYAEINLLEKIDVSSLSKTYGATQIAIPPLQFVYPNKYLIVGQNGVGKSVLMRLLMQFEAPDSGEILYNSYKEIDTSIHMNYVPQKPVIFNASYKDNVTVFGAYNDKDIPRYESFFPESMIKNIKKNLDPENLSGGEKQVIALIRALCSQKEVLLLDEPFSAMNQLTIDTFMAHIKEINRTIIIIAHNIDNYEETFDAVYKIGL